MKSIHRDYSLVVLSLVTGSVCTTSAHAGLLDNGTTTLNTDTGLEYLDLSFTNNATPAGYLDPAATPTRPVPAGFRPGTQAEALALFAEVGLVPDIPFDASAFAPIDFLLGFIGPLAETRLSGRTERESFFATSTPNGVNYQSIGYRLRVLDFDGTSTDYGILVQEAAGWTQASQTTATLHVRNKANATPGSALSASTTGANSQAFTGIDGNGVWVNANLPSAGELKLTGTAGNIIRAVGIAESFTDADNQLTLIDPTLGEIVLNPGDVYTLSTPSMMVNLTGIDPVAVSSLTATDAITVDATLPLFVAFDTAAGDLLITDVPEPTSLALLSLGGLLLSRRRR